MTYNVDIPDIVRDKIREQAYFIARDKPRTALDWYDKIFEDILSLEEFPDRCPIAPENKHFSFELRHLLIGNYRTLFRIEAPNVLILDFKERHQNK